MKNIVYGFIVLVSMLMLPSCTRYTDLVPKGKNLLNKASDLELLISQSYTGEAFNAYSQAVLIDDMYPLFVNVPGAIAGTLTLNKVLLTYDEKADRAALALTDGNYDGLYRFISSVANIVLINAETASGDPALLGQLKAEAYIIRAYMHYLLVNIYAKAYDPATAAVDGGVPYVKDINFEAVNTKNTVKEVYDNLLADVDAAIALNTLPDQPKNSMRVGKGFAYGLKARVLLSMRDYAGALAAVNSALTYNSILEDHRPLLAVPKASRVLVRNGTNAPHNVFYAYHGKVWPNLFSPTYEILANYYEPGNIVKDSTNAYDYAFGAIYSGLPNIPIFYMLSYESNAAGMTGSDLFMIKAECLIRTGKFPEAMGLINDVRIRRIAPYTPVTATTEAQGMAILQKTSRIEFLFTLRNFINIKRWNKEGKYPVTVERTINNVKYTLAPNSPLWIFPFPQSATQFNNTLTQNY